MVQLTKLEDIKGFEEQRTKGVSPWALAVQDELGPERPSARWSYTFQEFTFEIVEGSQSLWLIARFPMGGEVALRTAYCPDQAIQIREIVSEDDGIENGAPNSIHIDLDTVIGAYHVRLEFPRSDRALLRCTTTLTPQTSLFIPYWPRDLIPLGEADDLFSPSGVLHTKQVGLRSGLVYLSLTKPRAGSVLYFQNLTALNEYAEQTKTSLAEVVGGNWPELGLSLPAALDQPLEAGKAITVSDAYLAFSPQVPRDDLEMSEQFLDALAQVYLSLPRYETEYRDWPAIARRSLRDLNESEKCWKTIRNYHYLSAYVRDDDTPPESMVQLAVLLPLLEYSEWLNDGEIPILEHLMAGLPKFYDEDAGVYGRWLLTEAHKLDGSEPQLNPRLMDSWYLYHSLLNLSRLALRGDTTATKLFLDSMDFAIEVARRFKYTWPVFYNIDTFEIIKAETSEEQGGELDVAGLYAHVMLQAWDLTKEERYLEEAKKAARTLQGLGFHYMYQANSTGFSLGAMCRLWRETGDELFLRLSYLALANLFNNMWLWECNYGFAKDISTFFALFPLKDADYTAVYEEIEAIAAFHDYLAQIQDDAPEWVRILVPEFLRILIHKAVFYYPPNLSAEMLSQEPKTGEVDPKLWIPLEDMRDGWDKAGQVGQEIYGAGLAFGILPRHYLRLNEEGFMIFVDYPTRDFKHEQKGQASFHIYGDPRLTCRMRLMPIGRKSLPEFTVQARLDGKRVALQGRETEDGHLEYECFADQVVELRWSTGRKNSRRNGKE